MANKKKSYLPTIILLSILVIGLGLYGYSIASKSTPISINQISNSTGEVTLALSPSSINTALNTESSLSLTATTGSVKLMVLTVELAYDPSKISTPSVVAGNFLGNTLASPKVENGKITFTFAATPDSGGAEGTGQVATIKFKPTASGSSAISFTANSVATAVKNGERIPTNSLKSATDATITVAGSNQATSGNINTPVTTPTPTLTPAQNDISVVTTTPKPTTKPNTPTSTTTTTTTTSITQPTSTSTGNTPTYVVNDSTTNTAVLPVENSDSIVDSTAPSSSDLNIFQKVFSGWKIIFQSLANIFSN